MSKTKMYSILKMRNYDLENMSQFEVDGINYVFYHDTQELLLCYLGTEAIDELHIPATLEVEGKEHPVIGNIEPTFYNENIQKVYLPRTFREFFLCEENPGCHFIVDPENPYLTAENGILYSKDKSVLYACPRDMEADFHVPSTVTQICRYAFYATDKQHTVHIPDSVETIEDTAFDCYAGNVLFEGAKSHYTMENGIIFGSNNTRIIRVMRHDGGDLIIPEGVKEIAPSAFLNHISIKKLSLPKSLHIDESNPFQLIAKVEDIVAAEGNDTIMVKGNVLYTKDMKTILRAGSHISETFTVPTTVEYLSDNCFGYCQDLKTLVIPDIECFLEERAFAGCFNITNIYCYAEIVPNYDDESLYTVFSDITNENCTLHVRSGMKAEYKNDDEWGRFLTIIDDLSDKSSHHW